MKHIPNLGCRKQRLFFIATALAAGLIGGVSIYGGQILFIVNSSVGPATPSNANDQEVLNRLVQQGHKITLATCAAVAPADAAGQDLVLISSSVGNIYPKVATLCQQTLRNGVVPVLNCEPSLNDDLLLQTGTWFGGINGQISVTISDADGNHPLAAGKSGTIEIVEPGKTAVVSPASFLPTMGADAIGIAYIALSSRIVSWGYDAGARLADDATIVPSRRVAFFWNASTQPGVYNSNATDLFDAAVRWLIESAPRGESPLVNITSPSDGARFSLGENVPFAASATASGGRSISKVAFLIAASKAVAATNSPFRANISDLPEGRYTVVAKAIDSQGLFKLSAPVTIVVGSPPETIVLFAIDDKQVWRYDRSGRDLGTAWKEKDFDDSAWPEGKALIGQETGATAEPIRTPINRVSDTGNFIVTFYFRTHFNSPRSETTDAELSLRHVIDDGAVFYLNGVEVSRFNLARGAPFDANTLFLDHENSYEGPFKISAADLVSGDNVFAVEVHQASIGSSDIVFGAELKATVAEAPVVALSKFDPPTLKDGKLILSWTGTGTLQSSDMVTGAWIDIADAKSPYAVEGNAGVRFYRLRQ